MTNDKTTQPAQADGDWVRADDVRRLTRELDIALNGEAGAARQASLCDLVAQVKRRAAPQPEAQPHITEAQWREVFSEAAHASVLAVDELQARSIRTSVDKLLAAPLAQAEPRKPNYRAECWPESPHNKQAEQGGK